MRYCSRACGKRGIRQVDRQLEQTLLDLLESGSRSGSICPREVARVVANGQHFQSLEEYARRAARRLAHRGLVEILQGGRVVEPSDFRGPIRVRLPRR